METKVICIANADYERRCFTKGEIYTIDNNDTYNGIPCIAIFDFNMDSTSFYIDTKIHEFKKFSEHFMLFSEWREEQINSILND